MLKVRKAGIDVGIVVSDIAAQAHFYGHTLGLPRAGEIPLPDGRLHLYSCGQSLLKLYVRKDAKHSARAPFGDAAGIAYLTLDIENLDAAMASVLRDGATVITPISEFDAGVTLPEPAGRVRARYAMIADPEGNLVELLERS
ncbi:MAG: VOC family protein [Alphaproteobacteria bacterium]|nr:VOC family protein [Alphaproteobacteria bacterium]